MNATLVIMAAGMASRYGSMKQIEPVGLHGEVIADYSIYDAKRAGFNKVVFVIKREHEEVFHKMLVDRISEQIDVECVFQEMDDLPGAFKSRAGSIERTKPWGTGQAVIACRHAVKEHFAVINADDFYGATTYDNVIRHFNDPANGIGTTRYCSVGFELKNTVSDHGSVSRAVLNLTPDGHLTHIEEILKIEKYDDGIREAKPDGTFAELAEETLVSMNIWGFTPKVFGDMNDRFEAFLRENFSSSTAELYLPSLVGELIDEGRASVSVYPTQEKWFGVTYKPDAPIVREGIKRLIEAGRYPEKLWG